MDLKEILGEDLYKQVTEKLGDKKLLIDDGKLIPKHRLDEVIEQRNAYKEQLEQLNTKVSELQGQVKDAETWKQKVDELQGLNEQIKSDLENKLKAQKVEFTIKERLLTEKARNPRAVMALLDMQKVVVDGDKVIGLDEQINAIKESDPYLFAETQIKGQDPNFPDNTNNNESGPFGGYATKTEWAKNDPRGYAEARKRGFK